jgi:hypothetical protein
MLRLVIHASICLKQKKLVLVIWLWGCSVRVQMGVQRGLLFAEPPS